MKALFVSFPASNYEASVDFYKNVVGLRPLRESVDGPHRFTNFDIGGPALKIFEWTEHWHGSGHSGLFLETDSIDAAAERIRAEGGHATDIVIHTWGGRCCTVRDPFGNLFDLIDASEKGDA